MVSPAVIDPQGIDVRVLVQALFAYTDRFGVVVTMPLEGMFWLTDMAASVLAAKENAKIVRIIIRIFCVLCDGILFPLYQTDEY